MALSLPRKLLNHCRKVLEVPLCDTFAWTDSTVVLSWLRGNPRRFKPFVGNRVAEVMELIPPDRWQHVPGKTNPADCASRGLYPSELVQQNSWWNGPSSLHDSPSKWPVLPELIEKPEPNEEKVSSEELLEIGLVVIADELPLLGKISSYGRLKRVTAWMCRFIHNCRARSKYEPLLTGVLASSELVAAENLWIASAQQSTYPNELNILRKGNELFGATSDLFGRETNSLALHPISLALHPILDESGLMRVGGRLSQSSEPYERRHPIIVPGRHDLTKLMVRYEHSRLLHAGPTLVAASLARRYAIMERVR